MTTASPGASPGADLAADRLLLRDAVSAAGEVAMRHFRNHPRRWHKGPGQIVTEADIAIDDLLHDRLRGQRPGDGWLSEERPDDGSRATAARVWMVDPIDGTRAFAEGLAEFTISVALVEGGEPVLGIVLNPATGELFEAARGAGARLDGTPLRVSGHTALDGAHLLSSRTEMRRRHWAELVQGPRFSPISSLAYKLALIAAGRRDGLISLRPSHDWDLAAALLLIREAGGHLTEADGAPLTLNRTPPVHAGLAAAGTDRLHAALVTRLQAVRDRRSAG